jgi:hypothetical protein
MTAYFMIAMGILCLIYLICSIRTNLIFFLIFFSLVPAFGLLAGAFLHAAKGNAAIAGKCQEAAGAFTFVTCMCGWYFPFDLPRKLHLAAIEMFVYVNLMQSSTCRAWLRAQARSARSTTLNNRTIMGHCSTKQGRTRQWFGEKKF